MSRVSKRAMIQGLERVCWCIDKFVYQDHLVRRAPAMARTWNCSAARLSMRLDERWRIGYWDDDTAPAVPGLACEICRARPSTIFWPGDKGREFAVCGWCRIPEAETSDVEFVPSARRLNGFNPDH